MRAKPLRLKVSNRLRQFFGIQPAAALRRRTAVGASRLEVLEERLMLTGITITFDYSRDTGNFFTQTHRDVLEAAADILSSSLTDTLDAIVPGGSNTWTAKFTNPTTGSNDSVAGLVVPADTLIIYVGARSLGASLAVAGPGGFSASGTTAWLDTVKARGETGALSSPASDFGPWGGQLSFNTATPWHVSLTTNGLESHESDFFSVAIHEMAHVLGFGISDSWDARVSGSNFIGAASVAVYGGNVPISPAKTHWAEGTMYNGVEASMDPSLTNGTRRSFGDLDFAGLDDIGWAVDYNAVSTPDAPTLINPGIGESTTDTTPGFTWSSVTGGVEYDLWVNDVTDGTSGVIREMTLTSTFFTPTTALTPGHSYLWTVHTTDVAGDDSPWASHRRFSIRVGTPNIIAPTPSTMTTDVTPTFSWTASFGAVKYDIWVNDLTDGTSGVIRDMEVSSTSFTPTTALTPGHRYLWTVRGIGANGKPGTWAAHRTFSITVGKPELVAPASAGSTLDTTPTFSWTAVTGATLYDIWVNDLTDGTNGVIRDMAVAGTSFTPATPLTPGHTYLWTVRAIGANGKPGMWGTHRTFTIKVGRVKLSAPAANGTTSSLNPTFSWLAVDGAAKYDLWVNDLTDGTSGVIREPTLTSTSFTPTVPLIAGHTYIWTVRALGENGHAGAWGAHRKFTITVAFSEEGLKEQVSILARPTDFAEQAEESKAPADERPIPDEETRLTDAFFAHPETAISMVDRPSKNASSPVSHSRHR